MSRSSNCTIRTLYQLAIAKQKTDLGAAEVERRRVILSRRAAPDRYASTRGMGMSVMDLARDREAALDRIAAAGRAAVDDDGADIPVLGCMSMAFHDVTGDLQRRIGMAVVNPVAASLAMADLLVRAGLSHSKRAYPEPPTIEFLR